MNRISSHTARLRQSSQGFTLLEIALAMVILGVVAIYTLDMYQSISSRKKVMDDRGRMEEIVSALKAYFSGHEGLPPAASMGETDDVVPVADLSLGQMYRFDTFGRTYLYFQSDTASGFTVDGQPAAGVIISLGENQVQDFSYDNSDPAIPPKYVTGGDDILMPVEVNAEAVGIALAELEILGKRVEAYNREFAGVQNNRPTDAERNSAAYPNIPDKSYYGDTDSGAPPIIDPDDYDAQWLSTPDDPQTYPQLYPFYVDGTSEPLYSNFSHEAPSRYDVIFEKPDQDWPGAGEFGGIYTTWPSRPTDPTKAPEEGLGTQPPTDQLNGDLPPNFNSVDGISYWPNIVEPNFYDPTINDFGEYNPKPLEEVSWSYELIDEGGCNPDPTNLTPDYNCAYIELDASADPLQLIINQYGLGSRLGIDPWGNPYQWGYLNRILDDGTTVSPMVSHYHLFYSTGPDRTSGTADDILLF